MVPADLSSSRELLGGVRADVEDHLVVGHLAHRAHIGVRRGGELARHHHVDRQRNLRAARRAHAASSLRAISSMSLLAQRLADLDAGGRQERVGDAAADDQLVDLVEQRLEHRELGRDLRAGDDRHHRPRGLGQRALERLELGDQQRPGAGDRRKLRHAVGAGLGAMRGAEGVHHEHVAQRRHLPRQRLARPSSRPC